MFVSASLTRFASTLYISTGVCANFGLIIDTLGHATYSLFAEPLFCLYRSSSARMKIQTTGDLFTRDLRSNDADSDENVKKQ